MAYQPLNVGAAVGDSTADTLRNGGLKINANFVELYGFAAAAFPGQNVLAYGARGDASYDGSTGTDDTVAFQNAINAATSAGGTGLVVIPGRRTYKITSTLTVPVNGVHLAGWGNSSGDGQGEPPRLVWAGGSSGAMVHCTGSIGMFDHYFENLTIAGGAASVRLTSGVRFAGSGQTGKTDSGTGFRNVWFQNINGDAIRFEGYGSTNFFLDGGRFDAIYGGYGIYVNLQSANADFIGVITGNTNYVGGGAVQGKGFIWMDGEGFNPSRSHLIVSGLHTEINQDLLETFAAGTNPSDKQGVIRLGVTPGGGYTQHRLYVTGWVNSSAGVKSYSSIQVTAGSGTDADASDCVHVTIQEGHELNLFNSADNAATGEVRIFGGKVPATRRPGSVYQNSYMHGTMGLGSGPDSSYEGVRSFEWRRHGTTVRRGLTLQPETYAQITVDTPSSAGALAYCTDLNSTTRGATAAGGGSGKGQVTYDGTNWIVV